jgi:hypothetical protein
MDKLDLKKTLKQLYAPKAGRMELVEVPPLKALMIDGVGDPATSRAYADAIGALYTLSYTLKFMGKAATPPVDWSVMPLESLWWADDMAAFAKGDRANWRWTALIVQPDLVTAAMVDTARAKAAAKVNAATLGAVRFETFAEGPAAQVLYVGPWAQEAETIAALHAFIAQAGKSLAGKHHEIYLNDPRRVAPDKLKTVIRQPLA